MPVTGLVLACAAGRLDRVRADAVAGQLRVGGARAEVEVRPLAGSEALGAWERAEALRVELRACRAHAAVQVVSDLPGGDADGVAIAAVLRRGDARDALLSRAGTVLAYLPEGARVDALEQRQVAQILRRRRDLAAAVTVEDVVLAVERFDQGLGDGLIVRAADLDWLGWSERAAERFDIDQMIPAPGQAALALEARAGDGPTLAVLAELDDPWTAYAVAAERRCAARLGGRRESSVGVHAFTDGETMFIHGFVSNDDGSRAARLRWSGPSRSPEEVGDTLAELLESVGARDILSGADLPPSIRYAERRRQLIDELEDEEDARD